MSQMPYIPNPKAVSCAEKVGLPSWYTQDPMLPRPQVMLDPEKEQAFNKCMEDKNKDKFGDSSILTVEQRERIPREAKVIPISKQVAEKEDLILGLKPLHFGLAALGVAIATYFVYKNFKKTGTKKVIN